jgi:hypothetical protein
MAVLQRNTYIVHNVYFEYGRIRMNCKIWGSDNSGYEEYYHLGYNSAQSVKSQPTFRRNISPQFSGSNNWRWRAYVPPKRQLTFKEIHGVISQMRVLFKEKSYSNKYQKLLRNDHCIPTYEIYFTRCTQTNIAWNYVCVFFFADQLNDNIFLLPFSKLISEICSRLQKEWQFVIFRFVPKGTVSGGGKIWVYT